MQQAYKEIIDIHKDHDTPVVLMVNPLSFLDNYERGDYENTRETEKNYFVQDMNFTMFRERHPG
jgi:hypothetical protein